MAAHCGCYDGMNNCFVNTVVRVTGRVMGDGRYAKVVDINNIGFAAEERHGSESVLYSMAPDMLASSWAGLAGMHEETQLKVCSASDMAHTAVKVKVVVKTPMLAKMRGHKQEKLSEDRRERLSNPATPPHAP
jgi:hypothetical protein